MKNIQNVKKGDSIVGSENSINVIESYEEHIPKTMYEIELENGEKIKCSGNHLWYAETDIDREEKDNYKKLALEYFSDDPNLELLENDLNLPLQQVLDLMCSTDNHRKYILKCCDSLGHIAVNKYLSFMDIDFNTVPLETDVHLYSINDLLKFIKKMKLSLLENTGYFYFGKVYSTNVLFNGFNPEEINIPTIKDFKDAKKQS